MLNPKMVALAIDFSAFSIVHSWGTVSGAGGFAEPVTDICTSVWIKLLSLTGKHSKLSFIFLKNKQTEGALFMHVLFPFLDPRFHGCKNQKSPNPITHLTHTPGTTNSSKYSTASPELRCLTECSCRSPPHGLPWGSYSS